MINLMNAHFCRNETVLLVVVFISLKSIIEQRLVHTTYSAHTAADGRSRSPWLDTENGIFIIIPHASAPPIILVVDVVYCSAAEDSTKFRNHSALHFVIHGQWCRYYRRL